MLNILKKLKMYFANSLVQIYFTDKTHISFNKASKLLRKESRVRSGTCTFFQGEFIRDAVGVLENHKPKWEYDIGLNKKVMRCKFQRRMSNQWFRECVYNEADTQPRDIGYKNDEDSMRLRSKYMSKYFRNYIKNKTY